MPERSVEAMGGPVDAAADQFFVDGQVPWSAAVGHVWHFGARLVERPIGVAEGEVQHAAFADLVAVHQRSNLVLEGTSASLAAPVGLQQHVDVWAVLDDVQL